MQKKTNVQQKLQASFWASLFCWTVALACLAMPPVLFPLLRLAVMGSSFVFGVISLGIAAKYADRYCAIEFLEDCWQSQCLARKRVED